MSEERRVPAPTPGQQRVGVVFREPFVRPGTPEAHRHGCRCNFERNLHASIIAAERDPDEGTTIVVIHQDCPFHEVVSIPDEPERA